MTKLPGLFVVGTDTGVGKTVVSALIARELSQEGRRVGVLKPVATGALRVGDDWRCDDTEQLIAAVGWDVPRSQVTPLVFEEPLAPSVAARRLGTPLSWETLADAIAGALRWWEDRAELMIVEGVGGLLTPVAEGATVADIATRLDYPLVVVGRKGLGTLNHTLLTVEAAVRRGLRVSAIVLNGSEPPDGSLAEATNAEELVRLLEGVGPVVTVNFAADPSMISIVDGCMNWYDRARRPRGEGRT